MRHDFEKATCETLAAYLAAVLDDSDATGVPVVSYLDTMTADDAARIVIIAEDGETKEAGASNATVTVEVAVKTPLSQPTASADQTLHFARTNAVRDIFFTATPGADVAAYNVDGFAITHIETQRRFGTQLDRESGFLYSILELVCHCHTTD